jgi:hypothetical protein
MAVYISSLSSQAANKSRPHEPMLMTYLVHNMERVTHTQIKISMVILLVLL